MVSCVCKQEGILYSCHSRTFLLIRMLIFKCMISYTLVHFPNAYWWKINEFGRKDPRDTRIAIVRPNLKFYRFEKEMSGHFLSSLQSSDVEKSYTATLQQVCRLQGKCFGKVHSYVVILQFFIFVLFLDVLMGLNIPRTCVIQSEVVIKEDMSNILLLAIIAV